jgi:small-conductance mechanosensitive channel
MTSLAELINQYFGLGQTVSEIAAAAIIFAIAIIASWLCYSIFERYLSRWARKTKSRLDDEILRNVKAPLVLLAILVGAYYSLDSLSLLAPYFSLLASIFTVADILVVAFVIVRIANVSTGWYEQRRAEHGKEVSHHILFVLRRAIQIAIYIFAFLAVLLVFRIDLSGVVVGFGIGGIAIAFALQSVLGDAFSAFSIYFDRPFEIGDFIVVGDYAGTVARIGMKSTRLQLLQGEELIISNRELTTTNVRNFKKLAKRRIVVPIRVTYDTPLRKLRRIPVIVQEILSGMESTQLDTVYFKEIGTSSLNFEIVYYMLTPDYSKYLVTQEKINFEILEAFEKENIKLAFPTQTVLLSNEAIRKTLEPNG